MSKRFPLVFGSGPWVSRLGPHLPATPADVVLYVAGKVAEVEEIDPFVGAVRPKVPVPPGTVVEIDALSISHAVLPMRVGLPGARIGQVGMPIGPPGSRGRMTLVLGSPRPNPQPLRVAHRYLAQDRARASLVGDPIGMRVGRRLGYAPPTPLSGRFVRVRVSLDPPAFASLWEVRGTGEVTPTQDGVVTAAGAGPVFATTPLPTRDAGRSFLTGRVVVDPPISSDFAPRAAIGLHDGGVAIVTAIIDAAGFRHTGLLVGEGEWGDPAAWKLFPELELRAESPTTLRVLSQQGLTRGLRAGDRLRVPGGPQAGTLVVAHVRRNDLSQVLLDLQTPLPIDPDSEGARVVTGVLDLGVTASTWVLRVDAQDGVVVASAASAEAALVQVSGTVAPPLRAPLLLRGVSDPQTQGAGLFGSVVGVPAGRRSSGRRTERVSPTVRCASSRRYPPSSPRPTGSRSRPPRSFPRRARWSCGAAGVTTRPVWRSFPRSCRRGPSCRRRLRSRCATRPARGTSGSTCATGIVASCSPR